MLVALETKAAKNLHGTNASLIFQKAGAYLQSIDFTKENGSLQHAFETSLESVLGLGAMAKDLMTEQAKVDALQKLADNLPTSYAKRSQSRHVPRTISTASANKSLMPTCDADPRVSVSSSSRGKSQTRSRTATTSFIASHSRSSFNLATPQSRPSRLDSLALTRSTRTQSG